MMWVILLLTHSTDYSVYMYVCNFISLQVHSSQFLLTLSVVEECIVVTGASSQHIGMT